MRTLFDIYEIIERQAEIIQKQEEQIKELSACLLQYITLEELETIKNENDESILEINSKL